MKVLVTGGAGYIGSHISIVLLEQGHEVVLMDNLSNSKKVVVEKIEKLSGKKVIFYKYDLCNYGNLKEVFQNEAIDAVIHLAGLKAVGESVAIPLKYYSNNLLSTLNLIQAMEEFGVRNLIFSSSATVYGNPASVPITEDFPLSTTNPYGTTKLMVEQIITDYCAVNSTFNAVILRYFNPIGAHKSGEIGEDPNGIPNNLVPYITQVAVGKLEKVRVFGKDYPTADGTGVRDYIHVMDLAEGHAAAMQLFVEDKDCGLKIYNLGTGVGYSVLEIIRAFSKAVGKEIPYEITGRRPGDIPECYADSGKALSELGWKTKRNLDEMSEDSWRWQRMNPHGLS